jgi:hypothetical protein
MSRNLTAGMITEVQAENVRPILLFEGVMESGTVYYWTGYGNLSWNAQTWVGTGTLRRGIRSEKDRSDHQAVQAG